MYIMLDINVEYATNAITIRYQWNSMSNLLKGFFLIILVNFVICDLQVFFCKIFFFSPNLWHVFWDFFWDPKNYAWQMALQTARHLFFVWIFRHFFGGIVRNLFWDLALISREKRSQNRLLRGGFKVSTGLFVLSDVNMCYRHQHSDHVNHPFKGPLRHSMS